MEDGTQEGATVHSRMPGDAENLERRATAHVCGDDGQAAARPDCDDDEAQGGVGQRLSRQQRARGKASHAYTGWFEERLPGEATLAGVQPGGVARRERVQGIDANENAGDR